MNHLKGKYISFCGKDKTGKTSLSKMLFDYLASIGMDVFLVHEPGGSEVGLKIREAIKTPGISGKTRMFLYIADRTELAIEIIKAKKQGYTVIGDRCYFDSLAYQMVDKEVCDYFTYDQLNDLNRKAVNNLIPDYLFYINANNRTIIERINSDKKAGVLEEGWDFFENWDFLEKLDNSFNVVLENYVSTGTIFNTIDTTNTNKEESFNKLLEYLELK